MQHETSSPVVGDRLLRIKAVVGKVHLSESGIWAAVRAGTFPRPVRVSKQVTAWRESEIDSWIAALPTADPSVGNSPKHRRPAA